MSEVKDKTICGRAQMATMRDVSAFVDAMIQRTGNRYVFQYRRVNFQRDDGRDSHFYEVEWYEGDRP